MAGFLGNQPSQVPLTSADIVDGTVTADDLNSTQIALSIMEQT